LHIKVYFLVEKVKVLLNFMTDFQTEKKLVLNYFNELDKVSPNGTIEVIKKYVSKDFHLRATHPFNDLYGIEDVANKLWIPIKKSFSPIQRRMDIFYAGTNSIDNHKTKWVTSMGHLLGIFHKPFLGIKPNHKMAMLRYAEFYRVEDEKIIEGSFFLDVMNFMQQLRINIIPESTGLVGITPGPMTHDGLQFDKKEKQEGIDTNNLIERMAKRLIGEGMESGGMESVQSELILDWNNDMIWWGPGGIGASYTIEGYIKGHTAPFEKGLQFVDFTGHIASSAEGKFGGWFGWPNLLMKAKGNYLGLTSASEKISEMRVVDLYRRDNDKLAENWIFIDHLHFLKGLGIDLLDRYHKLNNTNS